MLRSWARWHARFRRNGVDAAMVMLPADPFAGVVQVTERLAALRAEPGLGAAELAQRLAEIDAAARRCYRDATRRYLAGLGREQAEILSAWGQGVENCLVPLAHAHQSLVVPWVHTRSGRALPSERVPEVLARGVRAGAAVLKWSYLRGAPEPVGVWGDLCRLYAMAEGRACAQTPVALAPGSDLQTSTEREFLQACMLAVVQPAALRPEQVDIAERVTHFCASGFGLSNAADPRFAYLIDIEGGDGPRAREADGIPAPTLRSFGMDGGERLLDALLRLVQSDRILPRGFGAEVDKAVVVATLEHLHACWRAAAETTPLPGTSEGEYAAGGEQLATS